MNVNDNPSDEPVSTVLSAASEDQPPVKRRARKTAAPKSELPDRPDAAPLVSPVPADPLELGDTARSDKPLRRREPKAKLATVAGTEPVGGDSGGASGLAQRPDLGFDPTMVSLSVAPPQFAEPTQSHEDAGAPSEARAPRPAALPQPQSAVTAVSEHAADNAAQAGGESEPNGAEVELNADGSERSRRGRNRRRGRRERLEGEAPEAEAAVSVAPGERAVLPTPTLAPAPAAVERFEEVLSGAYDAEPPEPDDEASVELATKRVLRPEPEVPKLHKVLAQSGIGSRRDMEQLIADGHVTVNDEVAHVGMRIAQGDRVAVGGKPVRLRILPPTARLLAYHKPTGEVVTQSDPEGRPTVFRRLPRLPSGKWQSVGRLDINTEGLLLFSNSGELANQLMHPRFGVEREYAVRVLGSLDPEQRARLIEGVEIEGQTAGFKSIEDGGGEGANRWYRVVITEGRNREVRKLFDKVGLAVSRLIRIRYGTVVLPRGLKRGVWVELGEQDLRLIRQLASAGRAEPREEREPRDARGPREPREPMPANREERRHGRGAKGAARPDARPLARGPQQGGQAGPRERVQGEARREPRPPGLAPEGDEVPREDSFLRIPNPLEQTFDRRFASGPRRGHAQGFGHGGSTQPDSDGGPVGTIPNPLEQTFDKRFVKGSQRINAGFGRHDAHQPEAGGPGKKGGPKQPDPMQTSVGYIGADAYFNKVGGKRSGGGGRGGHGGGGGGGGGGGRGRSR